MISLTARTAADDLYEVYASNATYWRYSGDLDPDTLDRATVSAVLDALGPGEESLVARDDAGRLVGYTEILRRHPTDGLPWIGLLLIDGRWHRQGHGRAIALAVEDRLRAAGHPAVRLGVLTNNPEAQSFWTALGYQQIDLRPDLAKGRPTLVLEKPL
ncbi:GNAT family N-acetyltransferase [Actinoplanes awajinensis]|uniref:N-acetyltransferase domain-containing protein n=1 Tax=Actinoplanes awajinensis subsp. mycoplanecinus TaxID=135947 RepID=A0A117ML90_9ACTN|nr:GNAT family N-acetyltransferase [Actinoplanes awajinensis]KUL23591.1 hypothetical protein ADL15_46365 [Actinoplanes awajinensis subsp. mycoplanecinus]